MSSFKSKYNPNILLGKTAQTPFEYEEILEDFVDILWENNVNNDLDYLLIKNECQILHDLCTLRMEEKNFDICKMQERVLLAMLKRGEYMKNTLMEYQSKTNNNEEEEEEIENIPLVSFCSSSSSFLIIKSFQEEITDEEKMDVLLQLFRWFLKSVNNLTDEFMVELKKPKFINNFIVNIANAQEAISEELSVDALKILLDLYNIFKKENKHNVILEALISIPQARELGLPLIKLFNWSNKDEYATLPTLRLLVDIFSSFQTSNFFYHNDLKVVLDICIRESIDLPEFHQLRKYYLKVIYNVLMNCTEYITMLYKQKEILNMTNDLIYAGEDTIDETSLTICNNIISNCSNLLKMQKCVSNNSLI